MERLSSSVQSWVEEHKLATIGGVWAAAVGASVAYSRRRTPPQRPTSRRLIHAKALLTLAVLGGGTALAHHHYYSTSKSREADLDYDFYSQLPSATDADGKENERWSWWMVFWFPGAGEN